MLRPSAYFRESRRYAGCILDHNDLLDDDTLAEDWNKTIELWAEQYVRERKEEGGRRIEERTEERGGRREEEGGRRREEGGGRR
jgi:hypothetical protein